MANIEIIDPTYYTGWDDLLLTNPQSSIFHTAEWARVLNKSYGFKPCYFTVIENAKLKTLLPVMEVKPLFSGKKGVSLPFTDFCPPLAGSRPDFDNLFEAAVRFGKDKGWKTIELRGGQEYLGDTVHSESFLTHTLDLGRPEKEIQAAFRDSTRRNIKKSEKQGVSVKLFNTLEAVREFYGLHCRTRRQHGLPPQPFCFFRHLYERLISKDLGCVILASVNDSRAVAGAIFLSFGRKAFYKYGASDKKYTHLRPNNLVMWQAIQEYAASGEESFNFGRTEIEHTGLRQFKLGWGVNESTLNYYKYDLARNAFVSVQTGIKTSYPALKMTPLPLLKLAGRLLYRHVG